MIMRISSAVLSGFLLIGCAQPKPSEEEMWQAVQGCNGEELCSKASIAALAMNKQAGRDFGNGVKLRNAVSDGRVVTVDLDVPVQVKDAPNREGRTIQQQFSDIMARKLCSGESMRRFFELGGEVRLRTFLPSNEVFFEDTLKSC